MNRKVIRSDQAPAAIGPYSQGITAGNFCFLSGQIPMNPRTGEMESGGIHVRAGSMAGLAEEAPVAYKDVDEVVETVSNAGIARKVARLRPVAVVKG